MFSDMAEDKLTEQLRNYICWNEQEEKDRAEILRRMAKEELFFRTNTGAHFSASAWVVSPDRSMVLMCYHRIYQSWCWLGGHSDGDHDLMRVAVGEVMEESGLRNVRPVSDDIFSLEILTVNGHIKKGEYISSHLHFNVTYLLEADPLSPLRGNEEENEGVMWFPFSEAPDASDEPWMRDRVYRKLNEKVIDSLRKG